MKAAFPLLFGCFLVAACQRKPSEEELEQQRRIEAVTPKPTPKPGAWMWPKNRPDPLAPPNHR
jgi:hypothetical protein